jgi:hypothetical protein
MVWMTRVKRKSDGRIFSSPRGAALHYKLPIAKSIAYCADGYLKEVEGEKWEWVFEEPKRKLNQPEDVLPKHSGRLLRRKTDLTLRDWIHTLLPVFLEWQRRHSKEYEKLYVVVDILPEIREIFEEIHGYPSGIKDNTFSLHLKANIWLYEHLLGMKLGYIYYTKTRKVNAVSFKYQFTVPQVYEIDDELVHALKDKVRYHPERLPVIRTNDGKKFRSISEAARYCKVQPDKIKMCCEGDIKYVEDELREVKYKFRYDTKRR